MSNMNFGVNLIPTANNTYDLGTSEKKWNLYVNTINGLDAADLVAMHNKVEFIVGTQESSTSTLLGVTTNIGTIAAGKIIYYLTPYAITSSAATLNLTYGNTESTTGAIPIYYGSTQCVTPYPANTILTLVYYDSKFYIVNTVAIATAV